MASDSVAFRRQSNLRNNSVAEISIVFVVFAAIALKTKGLKILEHILSSLGLWNDMVHMESCILRGRAAKKAALVPFQNSIPSCLNGIWVWTS